MNRALQYVICAALLSILVGCGGGEDAGTPTPPQTSDASISGYPFTPARCDTTTQRAWLRDYMNDEYLWFDRQGMPNEAAADMDAYLDSLLYKPTDRYSYTQSTGAYTQFFAEGKRTGYGYSLALDADDTLRVRSVEPLGPAGVAGLKRGDIIVSIDGKDARSIRSSGLPIVSSAGVTRSFTVSNATTGTRSFSVSSAEYTLSPVLDHRMLIASNGKKVAYLAYNEFIQSGNASLAAAIDLFRINGAQELILDLRYNGGGSTLIAQNLSYLLGGARLSGSVFARYTYNSKNTASNFTQRFTASSYTTPLAALPRLFVITSLGTASASEMVINGLRPYMNVITIGDTTYGKPFAFQPREACNITYSAVNLQILNANGFGDYASGIAPTCRVADDLRRALGDPAEARIAAALSYITTGACPSAASRETAASASIFNQPMATEQMAQELGLGEDGKPQRHPPGALFETR